VTSPEEVACDAARAARRRWNDARGFLEVYRWRSDQLSGAQGHSTVVRGAVAAVATSAAAYGVQRWMASRQESADEASADEVDGDDEADDEQADAASEDRGDKRGWSGKREELTQTLTSKAAEAKKAAAKLRPGVDRRSSSLEGAWESASPHLIRVAKEAASALGAAVAEKAPDVIREELMPCFIDGFEKGTGASGGRRSSSMEGKRSVWQFCADGQSGRQRMPLRRHDRSIR
jgi:hypothetical protein